MVQMCRTSCDATSPVTTQAPPPAPNPVTTQAPTPPAPVPEGMKLVFEDNFDGSGRLDETKWSFDRGASGWGNAEWQDYTSNQENVRRENGLLVLEARRKPNGPNAVGGYSSARIKTQGRFSFTYGRAEMRAKAPYGVGLWPAFWTLGDNIGSVGWPTCGEIDILEVFGTRNGRQVFSTIHTKAANHMDGTNRLVGSNFMALPTLDSDFHIYALDWTPTRLEITVDGKSHYSFDKPAGATNREWPFDAPHFLLLNIAVGGNGAGQNPDPSLFENGQPPVTYEVDYVRVYQRSEGYPIPSPGPSSSAPADCTSVDNDPWMGGQYKACCGGLEECTEDRDPNSPVFAQYPTVQMCRTSCDATSPVTTQAPPPAPTPVTTPAQAGVDTEVATFNLYEWNVGANNRWGELYDK